MDIENILKRANTAIENEETTISEQPLQLKPMHMKEFSTYVYMNLINQALNEMIKAAKERNIPEVQQWNEILVQHRHEEYEVQERMGTLVGLFQIHVGRPVGKEGFIILPEILMEYPSDYYDSAKAGTEVCKQFDVLKLVELLLNMYVYDENKEHYLFPNVQAAACYAAALTSSLEECGYEVLVDYGQAEEPQDAMTYVIRSHCQTEAIEMIQTVTDEEIKDVNEATHKLSEKRYEYAEAVKYMMKGGMMWITGMPSEFQYIKIIDKELIGFDEDGNNRPLTEKEKLRSQTSDWYKVLEINGEPERYYEFDEAIDMMKQGNPMSAILGSFDFYGIVGGQLKGFMRGFEDAYPIGEGELAIIKENKWYEVE